eukprot:130913_1
MSDTFQSNITVQAHGHTFMHIIAPSFYSSGSSWFRSLLNELSGNGIGCDIYHETKINLSKYKHQNLWCPNNAATAEDFGAVTIKTHFPHIDGDKNGTQFIHSDQHKASMSFDKVLVIVRDPESILKSIINRGWGNGNKIENIYCWNAWWDRVRVKLENDNKTDHFMYLRYEQLCSEPIHTMMQVFKFMETEINEEDIRSRYMKYQHRLKCKHPNSKPNWNYHQLSSELLTLWGYTK